MKGLSILVAMLGGMAVGAAAGLLLAPQKGDELRSNIKTKVQEALKARGIKLNRKEMENLVDDITDELKAAADE